MSGVSGKRKLNSLTDKEPLPGARISQRPRKPSLPGGVKHDHDSQHHPNRHHHRQLHHHHNSASTSQAKPAGLPIPSPSPRAVTAESLDSDLILPSTLPFKVSQAESRYPRGQTRFWKHLKQILLAENYQDLPADTPTYVSIEAPPSMYPAKKYCDITGFEAKYTDPRSTLRYADTSAFRLARSLAPETVQGYLALRNAAVVLK